MYLYFHIHACMPDIYVIFNLLHRNSFSSKVSLIKASKSMVMVLPSVLHLSSKSIRFSDCFEQIDIPDKCCYNYYTTGVHHLTNL